MFQNNLHYFNESLFDLYIFIFSYYSYRVSSFYNKNVIQDHLKLSGANKLSHLDY